MVEKVFLTDQRRAVLEGEYDGNEDTLRSHKSKIRERARTALEELREVAESPHIDNDDVFKTGELAGLIHGLMAPRGTTITPRWNYDGDDSEFFDEYRSQIIIHRRLTEELEGYDDFLNSRTPPGEPEPFFTEEQAEELAESMTEEQKQQFLEDDD